MRPGTSSGCSTPTSQRGCQNPIPNPGIAAGRGGRARPMPAQALPAALTAPPRPLLGSVLPDKPRLFAGHKVLGQPSTQSGSIIRGGPQGRGRGRPHNAHEWPPLLCLGSKAGPPARPLNGPIVAEPPQRPLGVFVPPPTPNPGSLGVSVPVRNVLR